MIDFPSLRIPIMSQRDVISCRQQARETAVKAGFGIADHTRLATAVSELARNALQYGGGGECLIEPGLHRGHNCLRVTITDGGPGIPDIDHAMEDGFSTENGLGLGLPASKRLVHRMEIDSRPGRTVIVIEMFLQQ